MGIVDNNFFQSSPSVIDRALRGIISPPGDVAPSAALPRYVYSQDVTSESKLIIGPLLYAHSVQNISVIESKAVESVKTTRSDKGLLMDKGDSVQRASIQLLFTGTDEINDGLRPLIMLFRCSPIISVKNELLSQNWKNPEYDVGVINNRRFVNFIKTNDEDITRATVKSFEGLTTKDIKNEVVDNLVTILKSDLNNKRKLRARTQSLLHQQEQRKNKIKDSSFFYTLLNDYSKKLNIKMTSKATGDFRKRVNDNFNGIRADLITRKQATRTDYIPVALETISIQNAPDLVNAYIVNLVVARLDVTPVTGGPLQYQGLRKGDRSPDPRNAYWLKKWLLEASGHITAVPNDRNLSGTIEFEWMSRDLLGHKIKVPKNYRFRHNLITFTTVGDNTRSLSEVSSFSYSMANHFGYQKLVGKEAPCAHHMGLSARAASFDLVFKTDGAGNSDWNKFLNFKELSDRYIRNEHRENRVSGWAIHHPLLKLLQMPRSKEDNAGTFVPLSVNIRTGSNPNIKHLSIDMMENNIDYIKGHEIVLHDGATDRDDLKKFYDRTMKDQLSFRASRNFLQSNPTSFQVALLGTQARLGVTPQEILKETQYAFDFVWPTTRQSLDISNTGQNGVLNMDTLRAALLYSHFDLQGELNAGFVPGLPVPHLTKKHALVELLRGTPLATGRTRINTSELDVISNVVENFRHVPLLTWPFGGSIAGMKSTSPAYAAVYNKIAESVSRMFAVSANNSPEFREFSRELTELLFTGFLGDRDVSLLQLLQLDLSSKSASGKAIAKIAASDYAFSEEFKEALFSVVIRRPPVPRGLVHPYNQSGVEHAFSWLLSNYTFQRDQVLPPRSGNRRDPLTNLDRDRRHHLYPDMYLPTYDQLYTRSHFRDHAPTFDDLGINSWLFFDQARISTKPDQDNQSEPAVFLNDKVHPAAWFYSRRFKPDLRAVAEKDVESMWSRGSKLELSIPFNTNDIADALELTTSAKDFQTLQNYIRSGQVGSGMKEVFKVLRNPGVAASSVGMTKEQARVVRVQDGDSFEAVIGSNRNPQKVRLIGVDTPESGDRRAAEAKEALAGFIEGQIVTLSFDPSRTGTYDRLLAYVEARGINVNYELAKMGFGTSIPRDLIANPRSQDEQAKANKLHITLERVIRETVESYRREDPKGFNQMSETLSAVSANDEYKKKYLGPSATHSIYLYLHHNDNFALRTKAKANFLGSELYAVLEDMGFLELPKTGTLPNPRVASFMKNSDNVTQHRFIRNMHESTASVVRSSLTQIPDDFESARKLWPAIKLYLIDHRGNDIVAEDAIFGVNPILSCDITLDKDEADLAIVKIGDPLYLLQQDHFPMSNTITRVDEDGNKKTKVLGSLRKEAGFESYLRRHKIAQGRSIQIRMGYDSVAENLQIVFTGRITEIEPGDVLTLVAQGWKAELINRKVAFSINDASGWGAQDLVIQTIQESGPDGIGQHFPQRDAEFILDNLQNLDQQDLVNRSLDVARNSPSKYGYIPVSTSVLRSIVSVGGLITLDAVEKKFKGIDTRLKNIWYPDIPNYSNTFNWRRITGVMPDFINDGWLIPQQPAWSAIKEATRHAWNCIAQVVPYDGQATLFFGHPDQPYYYTRGPSVARSKYKKYAKHYRDLFEEKIKDIGLEFLSDTDGYLEHPGNPQYMYDSIKDALVTGGSDTLAFSDLYIFSPSPVDFRRVAARSELANFTKYPQANAQFPSLWSCLKTDFAILNSGSRLDTIRGVDSSRLPTKMYQELVRDYGTSVVSVLLELFYGVDSAFISRHWGSAVYADMNNLMQPDSLEVTGFPGALFDTSGAPQGGLFSSSVRFDRLGLRLPGADSTIERSTQYINDGSDVTAFVRQGRVVNAGPVKPAGPAHSILGVMSPSLGPNGKVLTGQRPFSEVLLYYFPEFKAFVYHFARWLQHRTDIQAQMNTALTASEKIGLEPTMQVFRVHHWVDSDHDIISNKIVAATREMWNTVSIEHPKQSGLASTFGSETQNPAAIHAGVDWLYWPKQEVTKVLGLQFHPGLALANKKIRIFSELNCHGESLAAKLACTHLADGVRRMYRGQLIIRGRVIKPHDRIVLRDTYTDMRGPVEVESVVHHWSPDMGWVTNICPQAVCDANPGAAAIQTAIHEAAFSKVFGLIDGAFDVFMWASIIGSLGTGAGAAFGIRSGLKGFVGQLVKKNGIKNLLRTNLARTGNLFSGVARAGLNPIRQFQNLTRSFGGLGKTLITGLAATESAKLGADLWRRYTVINAFTAAHDPARGNSAEQLPVSLSPLMYQGLPWTAGLEADESVFALSLIDSFYSWRDMLLGLENFLEAEASDISDTLSKVR